MSLLPPPRRAGSGPLPPRRFVPPSMTAIRRRFLTEGFVSDEHLAPSIVRSWQRCAALGLRMDMRPTIEPLGRADLGERRERTERLRLAAGAEMHRLREVAAGSGGVVILTDADGVVVERLGEGDFTEKADRVALKTGVAWAEAVTGTNAIGAALAERRDACVFGAEHFFESHRILSCTAAPIFSPSGETLGVLDLSERAETRSPRTVDLVRGAVGAIERRFFLDVFGDAQILSVHREADGLGSEREGLIAFRDDRLVAIDRSAATMLAVDREAIEGRRWNELFDARRPDREEVGRLSTHSGRACFARFRPTSEKTSVGWRAPPPSGPVVPIARPPEAAPASPVAPATPREAAPIVWDEVRSKALSRAVRLVDADVPVLVQGETGTGKEIFARALHAASRRAGHPFVAVNCAALPEGLIEAELFGYEEGAFTGARRRGAKGLMREAEGGVLFLDEIGDMPLALQARLLRALQEREVTPLGGTRPVPVDFALVCATHMGLAAAVEGHGFRQDLYFRIAQYTVELAPLRGRSDLPALIERLWHDHARDGGVRLSPEALDRLAGFDWPGNFRQMVATLRTLAILAEPGEVLGEEALPADILRAGAERTVPSVGPTTISPFPSGSPAPVTPESGDLASLTEAAVRAAIEACGGNLTRAAARLGVHRSTLHRRLAARGRG